VLGVGSVPATGVAAVVLNLTAVNATTDTFVTKWPSGNLRPNASALNPRPGGAYPNLVVAQVGQGGRISLYNEAGYVDVLADVVGYYPADRFGNRLWVHGLGSTELDMATGVAVDGLRNAFVVGDTRGTLPASSGVSGWANVFLAKYSPAGELLWVRQVGTDAGEQASGVAVDPRGDIVITGFSERALPGSVEANRGGSDVFVAKFDTSGQQLWVRQLGSDQNDAPGGITTDPSGDILVVGRTAGLMDGAPEGRAGSYDGFVARLDPAGNRRWIHQFGAVPWDVASDVAVGPSGEVYVTGSMDGVPEIWEVFPASYNTFLAAYGPEGNRRWQTSLGTGYLDMSQAVAVDALSRVFIVGSTGGTLPGSPDLNTSSASSGLRLLDGFVAMYRTWPTAG